MREWFPLTKSPTRLRPDRKPFEWPGTAVLLGLPQIAADEGLQMPEPNDAWYFAYGSNLLRERKVERTRPIREARRCRLRDYRLVFNKRGSGGQVYANIAPEPTEEVWGAIYRCSPTTFEELDRFEGVASGHYRRITATVATDDGAQVPALTYIAGDEHVCPESGPNDEYLQLILRGARQHRLPQDYIRALSYRAQRRPLRPHQRLWRTFPVDRNLHNEWLARLNELVCFDLISICEGHPSQSGTSRSWPHVNLRLKAEFVNSVTDRWDALCPTLELLLAAARWPEAIIDAELRRTIYAGGNGNRPRDFVVHVRGDRSGERGPVAVDMVRWFGHCVPAAVTLDAGLQQLLGESD